MSFFVRDAGAWKEVLQGGGFSVRDAGTWKTVQAAWVYDAGTWKQFFTNFAVVWAGGVFSDSGTGAVVTATVGFDADGTGSTGSDGDATWGDPTGGTPGADYEVRLDVSSGLSPSSGDTTGAWHSLSTTRAWSLSRNTVGTSTGNWQIQIRRASDSVVLADAVAQMSAEKTA